MVDQCEVKKAKVALKAMSKTKDCSLFVSLPGLISQYTPEDASTVNALILNASDKDIIDHGRWVTLLGYLRKNKALNINLWIIPKKGVQGNVTKARPVIDYLIEKDYQGEINTHLVVGDFETVVSEIGMDNIDIVINDNPDIDDHNTKASLAMLTAMIENNIPYVISDISPLVLNFKLYIFNCWGLTATKPMEFNPYSLYVRKNISAPHRYMGYSYAIDASYSMRHIITKDEKLQFNNLAASLVSCLNIGEPLRKLPSISSLADVSGDVPLLEQFSLNVAAKSLTCLHSGSKVTIKLEGLPPCPVTSSENKLTNAQNAELTLWILGLYQRYLKSYKARESMAI